jgi:hypothetical protein
LHLRIGDPFTSADAGVNGIDRAATRVMAARQNIEFQSTL